MPKLTLEVYNEQVGDELDLEEHPEILDMPVDEAVEEALKILGDVPEASFRPTDSHDLVLEPSEGFSRRIHNRSRTLRDTLSAIHAEQTTLRVNTQARQADPAAGGAE